MGVKYDDIDIIEMYKEKLKGTRKTFVKGVWLRPDAIPNATKVTKYLIEEELKLSDDELKKQLSIKFFAKHCLGGMLSICFGDSPFLAINTVYPNKFKEWEFKQVPTKFWNISRGIEATKWLIEDKLKLSNDGIKEQLSQKLFTSNGLRGMLSICFGDSPFLAINTVYPNKFKEWDFKQVPTKFWTKERVIEATRWLIEEKLKLSDKELKEKLSVKLFKDNGLWGMLQQYCNGSFYKAIDIAYPNKFKEWEFNLVPQGFWTKERGIEATRWLIEEKLKLSDNELREKLSRASFIDNGLQGMLTICFNNSYKRAIQEAYPDKFK